MLDIAVPEKGLQRSRVVAAVCERVAAGVPQHVRVDLESELGCRACSLDHPSEASGGKRRATFGGENERRLWLLLAPEPTQGAQFVPKDRMRRHACRPQGPSWRPR